MTQVEWLACTDPQLMLGSLANKVTDRKTRLYVCACCRRVWGFLTHIDSRAAVETAERFADGLVQKEELDVVAARAGQCAHTTNTARLAARSARIRLGSTAEEATWRVGPQTAASILRELFNPFQTIHAIGPSVLAWNDGTVVRIATTIYDGRAFDRMPILADALEDAGCDNTEILAHCRGPNEHVRGCWVVDLVLGKQ